MKKVILSFWLMIVITVMITTTSNGYFSTSIRATGSIKVSLGIQKYEIYTETAEGKKKATVKNTGEVPNFIRVKIFKPSTITISCTGDNWQQDEDGYWYYLEGLNPQETTTELVISITKGNTGKVQSIMPVSESSVAFYTEYGDLNMNWSNKYYITNSSNG